MEKYISKSALVAEIERLILNGQTKLKESEECNDYESYVAWAEHIATCIKILSFLDTLEAKEEDLEEESAISNFKSLLHLNRDMKSTCKDFGYAPNLYYFDSKWHVSWISCSEGDTLIDFDGDEPEIAIQKACDWFHSEFCNC